MKATKKYTQACEIAKLPHENQESLYKQLNELGFFWDSKIQKWVRDDRLADEPTPFIRVRLWADSKKVEQAADCFIEACESYGLKLQEKSNPYPCRPPKQKESRIYLLFTETDQAE